MKYYIENSKNMITSQTKNMIVYLEYSKNNKNVILSYVNKDKMFFDFILLYFGELPLKYKRLLKYQEINLNINFLIISNLNQYWFNKIFKQLQEDFNIIEFKDFKDFNEIIYNRYSLKFLHKEVKYILNNTNFYFENRKEIGKLCYLYQLVNEPEILYISDNISEHSRIRFKQECSMIKITLHPSLINNTNNDNDLIEFMIKSIPIILWDSVGANGKNNLRIDKLTNKNKKWLIGFKGKVKKIIFKKKGFKNFKLMKSYNSIINKITFN